MAEAPDNKSNKPVGAKPGVKRPPVKRAAPASSGGGFGAMLDGVANFILGPPKSTSPKAGRASSPPAKPVASKTAAAQGSSSAPAAAETGVEEYEGRPLSPHLQIYKPQLASSVLSILHRMTGIALFVGAILLVALLVGAATGTSAYENVQGFIGSWIGQLMLFGWVWALFYHLCAGLRHLGFDFGFGFDLPTAHQTAYAVLIGATVLTLITWIFGYIRVLSAV